MISYIDKALLEIAKEREREEVKLGKEFFKAKEKEDIRLHRIPQQKRRNK